MESLLETLHQQFPRITPDIGLESSPSLYNMENGTALPVRPGPSDIAKEPSDTQTEPKNSKPNTKAPAENSKPPKAKKEKAPKVPKPSKGPMPPKAKKESAAKPSVEDPESMFKVGFLSDVYQERPVGPEGISKVVTRCKSTIQHFLLTLSVCTDLSYLLSSPRAKWFPPYRS